MSLPAPFPLAAIPIAAVGEAEVDAEEPAAPEADPPPDIVTFDPPV